MFDIMELRDLKLCVKLSSNGHKFATSAQEDIDAQISPLRLVVIGKRRLRSVITEDQGFINGPVSSCSGYIILQAIHESTRTSRSY